MLKRIVVFTLLIVIITGEFLFAEEINGEELYAMSACLLDADSGRVLYEKNGYEIKSMASTTKIMTCIIALEYGNQDDIVTVSKYAAGMPDVQLGIKQGEQYYLKDLIYSMMLESHNDVAVAIAEHISGSVEEFAELMNKKAVDLGCYDTYFITPNGLDATRNVDGEEKFHSTTAVDLARIMSYCIKNEEFLKITQTKNYSFNNIVAGEDGNVKTGSRSYTVNNKNAFLDMMEGVLSGKTGFTGKAGYCYVCAVERDGRTYIIALLGCGWPNNKSYKWSDSKKLVNYGINNYSKRKISNGDIELPHILVNNGYLKDSDETGGKLNADEEIYLSCYVKKYEKEFLAKDNENVEYEIKIKNVMEAPVYEGEVVGSIKYMINEDVVAIYNIYAENNVFSIDFSWCLKNVFRIYLAS